MKKLYVVSLIIFIFSSIAYTIFEWQYNQSSSKDAINTELNPDFIAETLKTRLYGKDGLLSLEVKAQRMEHYGDLDFTHFEYPKYTLYPKNQQSTWQLTANEATLQDDNRIILETRVLLKAADKNSLIQEIHCKYLELDLNTNILSSNQTIMVKGKDFTMYGSGLIVDLNTTQMTLTEHVQTIYKKTSL
jgi:lipopolysaccharide export system protein LptC